MARKPELPKREFTSFERFILITNIVLNFLSLVLLIMQLTGVRDTMLMYGSLFSITSFLEAYLDRDNDREYRRHIMFGFLFMAMMVLFSR